MSEPSSHPDPIDPTPARDAPALRRAVGLPVLALYGLGTILGAGIYVLVGEVAARAGAFAPWSFLAAALVAAVTGLSFAAFVRRHPESAGEAVYVQAGFGARWLSTAVGLGVALSGVVSAATIAVGFAGYVRVFAPAAPGWLATGGLVLVLGAVAAWGIDLSTRAAAVMTVVELAGLVLVIAVAGGEAGAVDAAALVPPAEWDAWAGIGLGGFLAFYAFIGFEDMVNLAEEVEAPRRSLPKAIAIALGAATLLYVAVALVCVLALPAAELASSDAPLAAVYAHATGSDPWLISAIGLVAVSNGALVQIVMGSRVLYGMARKQWLPAALAHVHPRRKTPLRATALVTAVILALALALPLATLAQVTSTVLLVVFTLIHAALWRVRRADGMGGRKLVLPVVGVLLTVGLLAVRIVA